MPRVRCVILVFSAVAFASLFCCRLQAGDELPKTFDWESGEKAPSPLLDSGGKCSSLKSFWCPDSYRPKCLPCIRPPAYCGGCDCYIPKCMPGICPPTYCGTCDCYDPKCPPGVKTPWYFPNFYKCPPPDCSAIPDAKLRLEK